MLVYTTINCHKEVLYKFITTPPLQGKDPNLPKILLGNFIDIERGKKYWTFSTVLLT
jgi:hypothetical protein